MGPPWGQGERKTSLGPGLTCWMVLLRPAPWNLSGFGKRASKQSQSGRKAPEHTETLSLPGRGWGADGPRRGRGRVALPATVARRVRTTGRASGEGRATRASDRRQGARDRMATRLG
eukprot:364810-Chlamydomonas_euryale.AAC.5